MRSARAVSSDDRPNDVQKAARDALDIMNDTIAKADARIVPEAKAAELARRIEDDVAHAAE